MGVPDEYRIFAYPEPEKSIKKAIAGQQQMINEATAASPANYCPKAKAT